MPINKNVLSSLTSNCKGLCDECSRSDVCEIYINFMFEACKDFEKNQIEEIEILFDDPERVDQLEKEVFKDV